MFILIVVALMANGHPGVTMQDFSSRPLCEAAADKLKSMSNSLAHEMPVTACVLK